MYLPSRRHGPRFPGCAFPRATSVAIVACLLLLPVGPTSQLAAGQQAQNWDPPVIDVFPKHNEFASGQRSLPELIDIGRKLFRASFNRLDGAGHPNSTGDSKPTIRVTRDLQLFQRVAGPDANSCAGCHNRPIVGGAGDFATNVFVGAHLTDPPATKIDAMVTNERHTLSIFGAGAIEMIAREMTSELQDQRDSARMRTAATHSNERVRLEAKGVVFGYITVYPDGSYSTDEVRGIDSDLIVKPFGVKGVAVSLREFTIFALNQHHGIQPEERFGWARTGVHDFDGDGVENEFTVGQVTALTVYQASLPAPRRVPYSDSELARLARLGERRFEDAGCASCHQPSLPLRAAWFFEPSPFNRPGSIVPADVAGQIALPISVEPNSGVYRTPEGEVRVQAFSDLKRHVICDSEDPYYCNERLRQDFVPTDQFLTTKLWNTGSSPNYGHRGDLTTVSEAIIHHSGEAKMARRTFLELTDEDKRAIIFFLKSLQIDESTQSIKTGGAQP
jgi:di-heme oxidoreductase (putative peroxidase)